MPEWLSLSNVIVPIMLVVIAAALFATIKIVARNYIKVAPNEVAVIYGRRYKTPDGQVRGFRMVTGGAAFVLPLLEKVQFLPLDAFQTSVVVTNVPSCHGVRVSIEAVATLKIGREDAMLEAAVSRFLNRNIEEIEGFSKEILEGGLRGVVASMTVEELVKERTKFGNNVQEEVANDLERLGLVLDNLVIQEIRDEGGYIDALGKKQSAAVKRDAAIAEAEAMRDQDISVAESKREADEKSSASRKSGEKAKASAEQEISNFVRLRDVTQAENNAQIKAEQAKIEIAAQIAAAQKDKELRVVRVDAEEAEAQARTRLQATEKKRHDAELDATLIVSSNRQREAAIIEAEGVKQSSIIKAEGEKRAIELTAEANRQKLEQESEANKLKAMREAEGRQAIAEARKAELLAEADGERAKLEAEAAGIEAKGRAEAASIREKAKAYSELDESGKLLIILEHLPEILKAAGSAVREAGQGTLAPMAQAIGEGIAGIEQVRIVDFGGNGQDSNGDAFNRYIDKVPQSVFRLIEQSGAMGLGDALSQLADKAGIDLAHVLDGSKDKKDGVEVEVSGNGEGKAATVAGAVVPASDAAKPMNGGKS